MGKTWMGMIDLLVSSLGNLTIKTNLDHGVYLPGRKDFVSRFRYQVRVVIKGTLFSKGMMWSGPWLDAVGNGPLMVHVPSADEAGVT